MCMGTSVRRRTFPENPQCHSRWKKSDTHLKAHCWRAHQIIRYFWRAPRDSQAEFLCLNSWKQHPQNILQCADKRATGLKTKCWTQTTQVPSPEKIFAHPANAAKSISLLLGEVSDLSNPWYLDDTFSIKVWNVDIILKMHIGEDHPAFITSSLGLNATVGLWSPWWLPFALRGLL